MRYAQRMSSAPESSDLDAVRILDHLVQRAVTMGASDIHIEPRRDGLRVRYRIDGVMSMQGTLPVELGPPLTSRVKVLAKMDMTERRTPQDGQLTLEQSGKLIHLRASTFPAVHGESVVLRVLLGHQMIPIEKLGMGDEDMVRMQGLAMRSSGLIVVCGPTGSGKTSTLYSLIKEMNTAQQSIVTLEDPIEVEFSEITQGQTNNRQGFTFATGLRAILRQDPDVILVGEMRDSETAQIALQASLTGHLVLSTLHTSSAIETIVRRIDLGVEPWIVANALLAVAAQRLVRTLCVHCSEPHIITAPITDDDGAVLLPAGAELRRGVGCPRCHGTGYRGRIGVFEILEVNDSLRELIKGRADKREYREAARRTGLVALRRAGVAAAVAGRTSLEEVLRVT